MFSLKYLIILFNRKNTIFLIQPMSIFRNFLIKSSLILNRMLNLRKLRRSQNWWLKTLHFLRLSWKGGKSRIMELWTLWWKRDVNLTLNILNETSLLVRAMHVGGLGSMPPTYARRFYGRQLEYSHQSV